MGLQLTPTRIKGSHYLLIPKDIAELLEINDESVLSLTIEDSDNGQRLIYSIIEPSAQDGLEHTTLPKHSAVSPR